MIARVLGCAEHLIEGKNTRAAINPLINRNTLIAILVLITEIQSIRIVAQDRCNKLGIEIRSSSNLLHRARKETIVMRKIGREHQRVSANGVSNIGHGLLLELERDKTLAAKINARSFF
jgi:hypothetical protein